MKKIVFIVLIMLFYGISFTQSIERQVIGTTGSITNNGTIQVSANIGEAAVTTCSTTSLIVTQGFEQPDTIYNVGIVPVENNLFKINAYPNPTTNEVILDVTVNNSMELGIEVYNSIGQQVIKPLYKTINNNNKEVLDFSTFATGNYIIIVQSKDKSISKSIKVQKIK